MNIKIGCGSWADEEYRGVLYPRKTPRDVRLRGYARYFDYLELNATAHVVPSRDKIAAWFNQTPEGFTVDIKLPKDFSFRPEKSARETNQIERLLAATEPITSSKKLGAFLLLLTDDFSPDKRQLDEIKAVQEKLGSHLLAVELRHRDWVNEANRERTMDFFREQKLVWIAVDMPQIKGSTLMPAVDEVTNPALAYLRLHGRNLKYTQLKTAEEKHTYVYSDSELDEIVGRIKQLAKKAKVVHAVANNHAEDFAPRTAWALKQKLGLSVPPLETDTPKKNKEAQGELGL